MFIYRKDFEALQSEIRQLRKALKKKQDYGLMSTALMRRLLGSIDNSEGSGSIR